MRIDVLRQNRFQTLHSSVRSFVIMGPVLRNSSSVHNLKQNHANPVSVNSRTSLTSFAYSERNADFTVSKGQSRCAALPLREALMNEPLRCRERMPWQKYIEMLLARCILELHLIKHSTLQLISWTASIKNTHIPTFDNSHPHLRRCASSPRALRVSLARP